MRARTAVRPPCRTAAPCAAAAAGPAMFSRTSQNSSTSCSPSLPADGVPPPEASRRGRGRARADGSDRGGPSFPRRRTPSPFPLLPTIGLTGRRSPSGCSRPETGTVSTRCRCSPRLRARCCAIRASRSCWPLTAGTPTLDEAVLEWLDGRCTYRSAPGAVLENNQTLDLIKDAGCRADENTAANMRLTVRLKERDERVAVWTYQPPPGVQSPELIRIWEGDPGTSRPASCGAHTSRKASVRGASRCSITSGTSPPIRRGSG